ncbi:MAG: hypothetical protein F6K39_17710 [Okeania sp. SIO3B3]|nr:hypothetical protein [Okeania sp. SIO3B3]
MNRKKGRRKREEERRKKEELKLIFFVNYLCVQPISVIATDREAISNPNFSYLMRKSC